MAPRSIDPFSRENMTMQSWRFPLLLLSTTLFSLSFAAGDTITTTTPISDGQTLISDGGTFELGFFSPGASRNRYLGIWYKNIPEQTVVWVANRANPIANSTGVLKIGVNGSLILVNSSSSTAAVWSSGSANASNPIAQLLDTGNLILRAAEGTIAWQSFDYMTNTLLPGMKLGWNLKTGLNRYLSSWKSSDDPSPGDYSFRLDLLESPEFFLYRGFTRIYASGPWNGLQFSGVPELRSEDWFTFSFISNQDEEYYMYEIKNQSVVSMLLLTKSGMLERRVWLGGGEGWHMFWSDPKDRCDNFAECGPFGVCNWNDSPFCGCLRGFEPKSPQNWNLRDGSDGCVRRKGLNCSSGSDDGFLKVSGLKLPETRNATVNKRLSLDECRQVCSMNCSCMGYASSSVVGGGSGCIIWTGDLVDIRAFEDWGQDLYIRLAASELGDVDSEKSNKSQLVVIVISTVSGSLLLWLCGYCFWTKKVAKNSKIAYLNARSRYRPVANLSKNCGVLGPTRTQCFDKYEKGNSKGLELPLLDIGTVMAATEDFAIANKLGEGGFGPVYKGKLVDGQDIAVKRLSKSSLQGLDEFKNEVILIAKLQHRNLVRLLGYCIHGEERMLIYEYMHNLSLDTFIFDETNSVVLNWQRRFAIILGIARGLLYLHQDSRFRIIHRDLKASNILLDKEMNPKISDFGLARIFQGNQTDAHTQRVIGTYGYMSPEYAMDGIFSMKSDVFSFGVLILEIVSGKKNRRFYQDDCHVNLLGYAWRLWKEGRILELIDGSMGGSCTISEVERCIKVGLLCVQEEARNRPMMGSVTMMLGNEIAALPEPNEPGFISSKSSADVEPSSCSVNEVSMTVITAR